MPTPTSIATLGNSTRTVLCSGLQAGFLYDQLVTTVEFPGISVKKDTSWQNPKEAYVNSGGEWKKVKEIYAIQGGAWKKTATLLTSSSSTPSVSIRVCSVEYEGDFGGLSYMEFFLPSGYYIPAGWKLTSFSWGGAYDVNLDGLYMCQSQLLAQSLGQTKSKALIFARSRSPVYTGLSSYVGESGVSSPGPSPSFFQWTTPSWARTDMINSGDHDEDVVSERVYSTNATPPGNCGGDINYNYPVTLPTGGYTLPFPVDRIVSARYSPSCGGCQRHCNHSSCPNTYFDFVAPPSPPPA